MAKGTILREINENLKILRRKHISTCHRMPQSYIWKKNYSKLHENKTLKLEYWQDS